MFIGGILKRVHILCGPSIMPFDSFEMTLSDSIKAYWALVPTTVLSSLQIVQDAREAVDLDVCPSQHTNSLNKGIGTSDHCAYSFIGEIVRPEALNLSGVSRMLCIPIPPIRWKVIIRHSNFVQVCTERFQPGECRHIKRTFDLHDRTLSFGGLSGG